MIAASCRSLELSIRKIGHKIRFFSALCEEIVVGGWRKVRWICVLLYFKFILGNYGTFIADM